MKKTIFLSLLLSASAFAAPKKLNFSCMTSMPTTTFELRTVGDKVVLKTIHHNGVAFMPIHEGIVVPHDFSYLQSVSEHLTVMGDENEFRFPISKCEVYGKGLMSCHGGERKVFGEYEMDALELHTSKVTEEAYGRTFEKRKVTLSVNILGYAPVQDITNDFYGNECSFDF
jgi:hypothetical protein